MQPTKLPPTTTKHLIDSTLYIYKDFSELYTYTKPVLSSYDSKLPDKNKLSLSTAEYLDDSIRRSKRKIRRLVLANDFELFTTFTFADRRGDLDFSRRRLSNWLHKTKKQLPDFGYVVIPEYHKDKKAIHFHGLMFGLPDTHLIDSNKKVNGRKSFNILSYKTGFTSAVKIDNSEKVSSYVTKYITKDMIKINEKKRYWRSRNLNNPQLKQNLDFVDLMQHNQQTTFENHQLKIQRIRSINLSNYMLKLNH